MGSVRLASGAALDGVRLGAGLHWGAGREGSNFEVSASHSSDLEEHRHNLTRRSRSCAANGAGGNDARPKNDVRPKPSLLRPVLVEFWATPFPTSGLIDPPYNFPSAGPPRHNQALELGLGCVLPHQGSIRQTLPQLCPPRWPNPAARCATPDTVPRRRKNGCARSTSLGGTRHSTISALDKVRNLSRKTTWCAVARAPVMQQHGANICNTCPNTLMITDTAMQNQKMILWERQPSGLRGCGESEELDGPGT